MNFELELQPASFCSIFLWKAYSHNFCESETRQPRENNCYNKYQFFVENRLTQVLDIRELRRPHRIAAHTMKLGQSSCIYLYTIQCIAQYVMEFEYAADVAGCRA